MKGIKQIDDYLITKELSKENDIILYEGINKKTNELVVIKAFPTSLFIDKRKLDFFKSELKLLSGFDHPNIIKFYSLKKTEKFYYLIMEYCNGGKLSEYKDYYERTYKCPLREELIKKILKELLNGLSYMHNCNTIHRNLSLDNIQLSFNSISNKIKPNQPREPLDYSKVSLMDCTIKITNLTFARELDENGVASTVVGSPMTMAPDVLINALQPQKKEYYSSNADLWTIGAMTYLLLVGKPPFDGHDVATKIKKLTQGSYSFPLNLNLSIEAMTLIDGLIQYSPENRIKWDELHKHPFVKNDMDTFHYMDIEALRAEGMSKELVLSIKESNSEYLWSKEKKNKNGDQPKQSNGKKNNNKDKEKNTNTNKEKDKKKNDKAKDNNNLMEDEEEIKQKIDEEVNKELQRQKKALDKEIKKIETEKQKTEQKLLKAEKEKKEAEELKQKTELEKTRLANYEKNQKELLEEKLRKEKEIKQKEDLIYQQEQEKLNKEKDTLKEAKKQTELLKYEIDVILKNAEKLKEEAEEAKKQLLKQKELDNQKKQEEEQKRQLELQDKDFSKNKLIHQIKQKEDQHKNEIAILEKNLLSFKALSTELKAEVNDKQKLQEILKEKESEHQRLLLQIEQMKNDNNAKIMQIEKETQLKELEIIKEKQRKEEEELQRKDQQLQNDIGFTKEKLNKMSIFKEELELNNNNNNNNGTINGNNDNKANELNINIGNNIFNDEWECFSTKSIEFNNTNDPDLSDYVLVNDYVSSKTTI